MLRTRLTCLSLFLLASGVLAQKSGGFSPGASGLGDPFFPLGGNGGYDVQHYALTLAYDPTSQLLDGTAILTAVATQGLSRFDLDLRGMTVTSCAVDGRAASFTRTGQELVVTPARNIPSGKTFSVTVRYSGVPETVVDPDGSSEGWMPTRDGAVALGEPQGSPAWYPCNDNPRDKATYDISVSVPSGLTAMSNGVLLSSVTSGGRTTWVWQESSPMATYLSTVVIGVFDLTVQTLPGGLPSYVAVDPQLGSASVLQKIPEIIAFFESLYGPYPFTSTGAIVDDARFIFYALETQSKPFFDRMPNEITLVHELSHQWYGDSVTPRTWPDLWLNEGFATWSEWIWEETHGGQSAQQTFDNLYNRSGASDPLWFPPAGDPGDPALLFSYSVYVRGGMTLQALRQKVGELAFTRILRDWAAEHRHGNASTPEFIALCERDTGLELDAFFDTWLYQPGKPTSW